MTTKATLHHLVDELPESKLDAAARYLGYLRDTQNPDPLIRLLDTAPEDDEPLTPEEEIAIEEGWAAYRRGEVVTDDQLRRELGL